MPAAAPTQLPPETPEAAKKRKQQLIAAVAIIAGLAVVVGISKLNFGKDEEATAAETTTSQTTTATPTTTTTTMRALPYSAPPLIRTTEASSITDEEMAFRAGLIRINFPDRKDIHALIRQGRAACADLDDGTSLAVAGAKVMAKNPSWSAEEAGQLMGISIGAYCPEHKNKLPR